MADANALSSGSISSLYPQPVASSQPSLLSDPTKVVGLMNALNQNKMFNATFPAQSQIPQAALEGQQIQNTTAQLDQNAKQQGFLINGLGALADDPNLNIDKVRNTAVTFARNLKLPGSMVNSWLSSLPSDPTQLRSTLNQMRNVAIGSAGTAQRVAGPPDASGAATQQPLGASNYSGTTPTELPPGVHDYQASNLSTYGEDQTKAAQTLGNVRQLTTALPLIQQLNNPSFGPGSSEFAKVKGALVTAGIIDPSTNDLQVRQEAGKYLLKYAKGAQDAGRSDQALSAAIGSNPNLDLTQPANLSLIKNQIGMDRQDAAAPNAFKNAPPEETSQGYRDYKSTFYPTTDPRAFSFDVRSPQERRQIIDSLGATDSPAYKKFQKSYAIAKKTQILTSEK